MLSRSEWCIANATANEPYPRTDRGCDCFPRTGHARDAGIGPFDELYSEKNLRTETPITGSQVLHRLRKGRGDQTISINARRKEREGRDLQCATQTDADIPFAECVRPHGV